MNRDPYGRGNYSDPSGGEEGAIEARPTLVDWARLVVAAAARRKVLFAVALIAGLLATAGYFALKTPMYRVETQLLAQRQQALPSIARSALDAQSFQEIPLPFLNQYKRDISLAWNPRLLQLRPNLERVKNVLLEKLKSR